MSAVEVSLHASRRPLGACADIDHGDWSILVRVLSVDLDGTAKPEWVRVTGSFHVEPAPESGAWLVPWKTLPERAQALLVDQLVAALRTLGCTSHASASDTIKQVDVRWPAQAREQVLARFAAEETR